MADTTVGDKKEFKILRLFDSHIGRVILIASFVVLTVALPLGFFILRNFISPVESWFDNAWQYRKPIDVDHTGSTLSNYDVLLTIDTAALIVESKIQSDCDDIRFVDSDDTTSLSYWIEQGCNTSTTSIWVQVPSVPNGGKNIYMYYGNGSATSGQQSWGGTVSLLSDKSCPAGWTRNSDGDGKYLYGGSTYGATGGSSSHSHGIMSCGLGVPTGVATAGSEYSGATSIAALSTHTHTLSITPGSSSAVPPYLDTIMCSNTSFSIPDGVAGEGWYDMSWPYRVKVTVDHTKVPANLTDFPVYINLANLPSGFHSNVNQIDARDIRVTKSDGTTELPREVGWYDSATDNGELYFKYSGTLSSTVDTEIYLYYGYASASNYSESATYGSNNVWDTSYKGVWHLGEASDATRVDSTLNNNDLTESPSDVVDRYESGSIRGADFERTDTEYLTIPDASQTGLDLGNSFTFTTRLNVESAPFGGGAHQGVIAKAAGGGWSYGLSTGSAGTNSFGFMIDNDGFAGGGVAIGTDTDFFTVSNWNTYHIVYNGSIVRIYKDGVEQTSFNFPYSTSMTPINSASAFRLGNFESQNGYYDGIMDEIRVSNVARSANWVATEHNNVSSPATFYAVGSQEVPSSPDSGLMAMFDASIPSGWTRFSALDSKFPVSAVSYGGTGGVSNHNHTYSGVDSGGVSGSANVTKVDTGNGADGNAVVNSTKDINSVPLGSDQTVFDSGPNAYHGFRGTSYSVNAEDPAWSGSGPNHIGRSATFDGSNDRIDTGYSAGNIFGDGTSDFTISSWISAQNPPSYWAWGGAIGATATVGGCSLGKFGLHVEYTSSTAREVQFSIPLSSGQGCQGDTTISSSAINLDEWYHVAGTYKASDKSMKLYINGDLAASGTWQGTDTISWNSHAFIGSLSGSEYRFSGSISDVRVYDATRSETQIESDMSSVLVGNESGLVGYWKLDDNITRTCADGINYNVTALTSTSATLSATPGAGCLSNGDEIMLINLQGTSSNFENVGKYEFLRVSNVSSNTVTFATSKINNYGDGANDSNIGDWLGNQRVILQRVPNYKNLTVESGGTINPGEWDQVKGGVVAFRVAGKLLVKNGGLVSASLKGHEGAVEGDDGFGGGRGGGSLCNPSNWGGQGGDRGIENNASGTCGGGGGGSSDTTAYPSKSGSSSGGTGGGGGAAFGTGASENGYGGDGGGGGYGTAGQGGYGGDTGANSGSNGTTNSDGNGASGSSGAGQDLGNTDYGGGGGGGGSVGPANLSSIFLGSGGGSGGGGESGNGTGQFGGAGGRGGGIIMIYGSTVSLNSGASVTSNGGAGTAAPNAYGGDGGGGAGGGILIKGDSVTLGSSLVTATGGSAADTATGGNGRIAIYYGSGYTGSTSPAANFYQLSSSEVKLAHLHSIPSGSLENASTLPPYLDLLFASKDSAGQLPSGSIIIVNQLPPLGWQRYTALDGKFPRGNATPGGTGGAATHTHALNLSTSVDSGSNKVTSYGTVTTTASASHTHSCSAITDSQSSLPPYLQVIYAQRKDNSGDSVSFTVGSEELNVPDTPTATAPSALSTTSIRWTFTDNADNEDGVKVFDMLGNLKATCVGADIAYCDETGLSPNVSYQRQLKAYNENGDSQTYSSSISRYTLIQTPSIALGTITTSEIPLTASGVSNETEGSSGIYFDCTGTSCDTGLNAWQTSMNATATSLSDNTQYTFRVKGRNGDGVETAYSSNVTIYTLASVPSISYGSVGPTSIEVLTSGTSNLGQGQSAVMFDCTTAGCNESGSWDSDGAEIISGLIPNTQYTFRVKTRNGDGIETAYSSTSNKYSAANTPLVPSFAEVSSNYVKIALNSDLNSNPTSTEYAFFEESSSKYVNGTTNQLQVAPFWYTASSWGTNFQVNNLDEGLQYTFKVKARNSENTETAYSSSISTYTNLLTPNILTPVAVDGDTISWRFNNNGLNETGFKLYDGGDSFIANCTANLVSGDTYECVENSLNVNTSYTRKLSAYNGGTESSKSSSSTLYTLSVTPDAPSITAGQTTATIGINPGGNPTYTKFKILIDDTYYVDGNGSLVTSPATWKTEAEWEGITITSLTPNTSYFATVIARNESNVETSQSSQGQFVTLAADSVAPSVSSLSSTVINVKINPQTNPSNTEFAVFEDVTDQYLNPANGQLVSEVQWGTYAQWGGTSGVDSIGLSSNTQYTYKVKARNINNIEGALSTGSSIYTRSKTPNAPTLSALSTTVLKLVLDVNNNPSNTEFSVQVGGSNYINHQTGVAQGSADWATYAQWGGSNGLGVSGLSPNNGYTFQVMARNGDQVVTVFGSSATKYTFANTPGVPDVQRISSATARVTLDSNGNPASVTYAVQEVNSGDYVNSSGNFVQNEAWDQFADYGGDSGFIASGLEPGVGYAFRVKARNNDGEETSYSNASGEYEALGAPTMGTPEVLSSTSIRWKFTEDLTNEVGFRVFDESGVQVAQCASSNITYCDEFGLTANTSYTRKVAAYDSNGNGDFTSTATITTFANIPDAPNVSAVSNTSINVKINTGSNNTTTSYALLETVSGLYVNPGNGSLGTTPTWSSYSDFGQTTGVNVVGLFANAQYTFAVKAKNSDNVETDVSLTGQKYTHAAPLDLPILEAVSDTSVRIKVSNGGNPPATQFSIRENSLKYVPKSGGNLSDSAIWGTYSEFGSSNGVVVTGLTPNATYTFKVYVRNGDEVVSFETEGVQVTTLAPRPVPLGLSNLSTNSIKLKLDNQYSSSTSSFSIKIDGLDKFVNLSGAQVDSPVWGTYAQWGGSSGVTVTQLVPGKFYTFLVKSRNQQNVETEYSDAATAHTNALVPGEPTFNTQSTTGGRIRLVNPGNDSLVLYAIFEVASGKFVSKEDGTLKSTASWGTYEEFGGNNGFLIKGLPSASDFEFKVKARNGNNVETIYGTKIIVKTNAVVFSAPAGVTVVLKDLPEVNVAQFEGAQRGEKELKVTKGDLLIADLPVLFDSDKDWSSVRADSSKLENKAVFKITQQQGLSGNFTLYTPAGETTRFRLCPGSLTLADVNSNCEGGVIFEGVFPQTKKIEGEDVVVHKEKIGNIDYWVASGLSGTGGMGEIVEVESPVSEPTEGNQVTPTEEELTEEDIVIPTESLVKGINNPTVKKVADAVLVKAPKATIVAAKKVSKIIDATPVGKLSEPQLSVVASAATATTVSVGIAVFAGGFTNIPYFLIQLLVSILSFFGFIKKSRPYGLVYDAVSKKPINRAVVRIYNTSERLVWTDVTSAFGTFGASLPPGKYKVLVVKPGYTYPSKIVPGHVDYPLEPVYHGELVNFMRKSMFNIVVPMDPKALSPISKVFAQFLSSASILVKIFHITLFFGGLALGAYTYFKFPSPLNLTAVLLYLPASMLLIKNITIKKQSFGMVVEKSGSPVEGVTVTLKEMKFDRYVGKRVTDKEGQYQFVMPNDTYQLGVMDERYKAVRYEGGSSIITKKRKAKEIVVDRGIIVKKK